MLAVAVVLAIALPVVRWHNAPSHDDHNFGIGKTYHFASFRVFNGDSTFTLDQRELSAIEENWQFARFDNEISITNELYRHGRKATYLAELNDGFVLDWDFHIGFVDGDCYLTVSLLGNDIGFQRDSYSILLRATDFLDSARYNELLQWLEIPEPKNVG